MKKLFIAMIAAATVLAACGKEPVTPDDPTPGSEPTPDTPVIEYLDLLITAPSFMTEGWAKDDVVNVSTGGYKVYPYVAMESGKTVRFTSAVEESGIVKNKVNTYSLQISIGEETDLPVTQVIADGKNTTEVPSTAACRDKSPNADGLLELVFTESAGATIYLDFAAEDVTLESLECTALGGELIIGQNSGFTLEFQGGLNLSSGPRVPVYVTPAAAIVFSSGVLAVANPGKAEEMARVFLVGKELAFSTTELGTQEAVVSLDKWQLGGIASADDLFAYSYCANHGLSTKRFFSDAGELKLFADVDMAGIEWKPIPSFKGIFDGCGHKIDNLTYTESSEGLPITYGTRNSKVVAGFIAELGSDAGSDASTLKNVVFGENCYFKLTCLADAAMGVIGGIVGRAGYGCTIENVTNKAKVDMINEPKSGKYNYMGGLVGVFNGKLISSCTAEGQVGAIIPGDANTWQTETAISTICGIAIEQSEITISDCHVKASATTYAHVRVSNNFALETGYYTVGNVARAGTAGIVGIIGESKVQKAGKVKVVSCSNEAQISSGWWTEKYDYPLTTPRTEDIAIDYNFNMQNNLGGIVGLVGHKENGGSATIDNCTNSGKILLSGYAKSNPMHSSAGGILGAALSSGSVFTNLTNTGDIILHGQQIGELGGCIGIVFPCSTGGDSKYFTGNVSTVSNLNNSGNIYISGTKTYFKHGNAPHIMLGGVIGIAMGQYGEVGTPAKAQVFAKCINTGTVTNKCADKSGEESFAFGGIIGGCGNSAFEECENRGTVSTQKPHVLTVGGLVGNFFSQIKTAKGESNAKDYYNSMYFKSCKMSGSLESADWTKGDYGYVVGWNSRIGSYFSASENSGNKISGSFGPSDSKTTITKDNYASVILRCDKTPAAGQIHYVQGKISNDTQLGLENDNLWNSFTYGE